MAPWKRRFAAIDVETTGLGEGARLLEFAVVLFSSGREFCSFQSLVRPEDFDPDAPWIREALNVNRLDPEALRVAPTFGPLVEPLLEILSLAPVLVGHNIEFDLRVLDAELAHAMGFTEWRTWRASFRSQRLLFDTIGLDEALIPGPNSHGLAAVAERWAVPAGDHRAYPDALACGRIFAKMLERLPSDGAAALAMQTLALEKRAARIARRNQEGAPS